MRPSSSISFEPGLERGMPWGRDLVTFMTSAAGYMMRTLQKPRKNKPSKRQVNHRRFLHNMIQRKFAEIEAANHQLASALFSVDTESQRQSEVKSTHKQESEKSQRKDTAIFIEAETKHLDEEHDLDSLVTHSTESSLENKSLNNQNNGKVNWIRANGELLECTNENSPEITDFTGEREQIQCVSVDLSDFQSPPISNIILDDSLLTSLESIERITENSHNSPEGEQQQPFFWLTLFDLTPTSPVSPLSLNSCDFEVQIQPDNDHTSQIQHTAENLQLDFMENLELLDSAEYLQQIDQMDMDTVWDVHSEKDLSCFQDSLPFLNPSRTDCAMDKQASCGDGDICGGLQQISTLLENSVKDMNVEDELRSNMTYSLAHCGSSSHHNQVRQTRAPVDCYINQPEISTAVNKEGQYSTRGTRYVSEMGKVSSHVLQELKHDLLYQNRSKNWEQHLSYNNHAPREVKDPYFMLPDQDKKMIESGSTLHPNLDNFNPLSSSTEDCYGFDIPLQAESTYIGDSCSFSNDRSNQSIPSFEGVAQYFPAPHQNPHSHPVSTPPLNDDWLFSNIATEVDNMVISYGHNYC